MAIDGMQVIALEEHYYDPGVAANYAEGRLPRRRRFRHAPLH